MTAVLIIPLAFASAGQGTWLAYAFATVMLLFVVLCLNQFAKRSAFAGSMYAYTARGSGPARGSSRAGPSSGPTTSSPWRACAGSRSSPPNCSRSGTTGRYTRYLLRYQRGACWVIAYKDIRVSTILTLALECASVACITALAFVILFKHGFKVDTTQLSGGVNVRGMGLAVVACISRSSASRRRRQWGRRRRIHGKHAPCRDRQSARHRACSWSSWPTSRWGDEQLRQRLDLGSAQLPGAGLRGELVQDPCLHRRHGELLLALAVLPQLRGHGSCTRWPVTASSRDTWAGRTRNRTPHVAVTMYIAMIFALPAFLMIFTNPLTAFGDAGTLAAFGFLVAYYLISVAAPVYLKKMGELRGAIWSWRGWRALPPGAAHRELLPGAAITGGHVPVHLRGVDGPRRGLWFYVVSKRQAGILTEIEADLERTPQHVDDEIIVPELSPQPAMA